MSDRPAASSEVYDYFDNLARQKDICYAIAGEARKLGIDPETFVEIPQAEDLASRVEKLLHDYDVEGVAEDIRRLTAEYGNRELVSLMVAKEVAHRHAESTEKALERAIRVGLAVLTEGILVAPLEGIADVKIKRNDDGTDFVDLLFAGPIRAAGGTAQAMSVLIADVVRRELKIGRYVPTEAEISRFDEEIPLYKQEQHLQYLPSSKEIDLIVRNCPIMIDGEGTERAEISGYRDLPRIETNQVRGGACLVIAEGLCQKALKLKKHVDSLKIDGWDFITDFLDSKEPVQEARDEEEEEEEEEDEEGVKAKGTYLTDLVAGRPIFGHPIEKGGFRLRYGRARTTGLAALAFNPASMYAMEEFMAIGTQLKIERPGKACVVTPCNGIEGPILLLDNGDLIYCDTVDEVQEVRKRIVQIVDNGEVLIPFGEFCENNHVLAPPGYCLEWHKQELKKHGDLPEDWVSPTYARAKEMSASLGVPLHPKYNLFWSDFNLDTITELRDYIAENGSYYDGHVSVPLDPAIKKTMEELGALHSLRNGRVVVSEVYSEPILDCLGLCTEKGNIVRKGGFGGNNVLGAVSSAAGYEVRGRGGTRVGMRMGRPEKAKEREMSPSVHCLFPVGKEPGTNKEMISAIDVAKRSSTKSSGIVSLEVGTRRCSACGKTGWKPKCGECGGHTEYENVNRLMGQGRPSTPINLDEELNKACAAIGESRPKALKCVESLTSRKKVPEAIEKGILRAKNGVSTYKDGTIRYDMTDIPLTHFRPSEIELSVEKAIELGYTEDWNGNPLTDPDQICELKVQDIIPAIECGNFMVKVANYVDDELEKIYGLKRYYNIKERRELIGHIVFGLAPHTSGGILCRIIGYSPARGCFGHPFFHASKRRNCDGDEDCIILAMDALLNFSFSFLPDRRGGLMDAPLVLTTRLDPNEIDKEAHNIDCLREYPLILYESAMEMKDPKSIDRHMDLVAGRIGTPGQYEGLGFTHDTSNISEGPKYSAYITLGSMMDKMEAQLSLGEKIRAVDEKNVATLVINKHFMPDMIGNLRSFSAQTFRCTKCGEKYRRIPMTGKCRNCGNGLTMTVHKASVMKYLEISKTIGEKYDLDKYVRDRIDILDMSMKSVFENDKVKKCKLTDFF